jgi:hypothetical protein
MGNELVKDSVMGEYGELEEELTGELVGELEVGSMADMMLGEPQSLSAKKN